MKKIKFNKGEEVFTIKVQDIDGSLSSKWVVMKSDFLRAVSILKKKYGIKEKPKSERDLDWLP